MVGRISAVVACLLISAMTLTAKPAEQECVVPVLLYHHLGAEEPGNADILDPASFQHHIALLREQGYQAVSLNDLLNYVDEGVELPEKAFCITFDDGYSSSYEVAYPLLCEYEYPATIFAIGSSFGRSGDAAQHILPHFGQAEMRRMRASGLISVQSHTFDMHNELRKGAEVEHIRTSLKPLKDETAEEYRKALVSDIKAWRILIEDEKDPDIAISYPRGFFSDECDAVLKEAGYRISFTIEKEKKNRIVKGEAETLWRLGRLSVFPDTSDKEILEYLNRR